MLWVKSACRKLKKNDRKPIGSASFPARSIIPFIAPLAEEEISEAEIEKSEDGAMFEPPPISIFGNTSVTVSTCGIGDLAKAGAADAVLSATVTILMCRRF